jgi:hypothetical protein
MRTLAGLILLSVLLQGCGVASTGAAGAAGAQSAAEDAARAHDQEERVRQQVDDAAAQAQKQRDEAERQNQ